MIRLLAETGVLGDSNPVLSAACAKHLRVVRPKDGEEVELFDGKGSTRLYRYGKAVPGSGLEAVREAEFHSPPASRLTLFACVTKGARWDWTIEKATELGVSSIVPVLSARTIVRISGDEREPKRQRWLRIAEEAARQSDAKYIPEIAEPADFAAALESAAKTLCFIGALTSPPSPPLAVAIEAMKADAREPAVFVGPEGDFTAQELSALKEVAVPASFGPSVLRAETAAIFALSVVAAAVHAAES